MQEFYAPFSNNLLPLLSTFVKREKIALDKLSRLMDSIFVALRISTKFFDPVQDACKNILITLFARRQLEMQSDILNAFDQHLRKEESWVPSLVTILFDWSYSDSVVFVVLFFCSFSFF